MKYWKFNRLHFFFLHSSALVWINNSERGQNLRKIFTLTVDSACWSPLVATHLYTPASSVPALYSVRMDDDSSLRVTVMSGLFCSILSPLGPNQSMCLATPATEITENTYVVNKVIENICISTIFTERGMKSAYVPAKTEPISNKRRQIFFSTLVKYVKTINQSWQPNLTFTHEEFGLSEADLSMSRCDLDFEWNCRWKKNKHKWEQTKSIYAH